MGDSIAHTLSTVKLAKRGRGNPSKKTKTLYLDCVCSFDIETSKARIPELDNNYHAWMYVWQFAIGHTVYIGRTWQDYIIFTDFIKRLTADNVYMVVYVHNLSYEFQFLSGVFDFKDGDVFCVKSRKILKATTGSIEYRCSMQHSNMSLEKWTTQLDVYHKKLKEYDYDKIRYPWTPLSDKELAYQCYDVLGVVECIRMEMERDGDNLYKIPLTSTGYVRRDVKRAMHDIAHNLRYQQRMDEELYLMLKRAFRGGDTHANRFKVNKIITNVQSYDRSSSYPDVMINRKFPMSKFLPDPSVQTIDDVMEAIVRREKAVLVDVVIKNYSQRDRYNGFPYLSLSKCRNVSKDADIDNGRIIRASYLETTLTDIDLLIVMQECSDETKFVPIKYLCARYGYLPKQFRGIIQSYYVSKTELKGIESKKYYYNKSKNKLNANFGLTVQDPCKDNIIYDDEYFNEYEEKELYHEEGIAISELLEKYYKSCFTVYAWGIWVTALARLELRKAIWLVGARNAVYVDTDSVKFEGAADFAGLNEKYIKASLSNGAYAVDPNGKTHYMGVYEYEGTYKEFATLGAKKYVYRDEKNDLHITIAGVNKIKGAEELEKAGGIKTFLLGTSDYIGTGIQEVNQKGFIFKKGGGNELIYNDDRFYGTIEREGRKLDITRNVVIKESTYQLGISRDYKIILEGIEEDYAEEYE